MFRTGAEGKVREEIIKLKYLRAIIALPSNLFYNTSVNTCLWVFDKLYEDNEGLHIINAEKLYVKRGKQNVIEEEHINKILNALQVDSVKRLSKYVTLEEVETNDWNLSARRYVDDSFPSLAGYNRELQLGGIPLEFLEHEFVKSALSGVDYNKVFKLIDADRKAYWWRYTKKREVREYDIKQLLSNAWSDTEEAQHVYKKLVHYTLGGSAEFHANFIQRISDTERMIEALYTDGEDSSKHIGQPTIDVPLEEWTVDNLTYRIDILTQEIATKQERIGELQNELNNRSETDAAVIWTNKRTELF